jgi:hypothetical protein
MDPVVCRLHDRFLVKVIGGSHDDGIHILSAIQNIQIRLHLTAQLPGHCLGVFRIIHSHHLSAFLLLHDAGQLRPKISCSNYCVSYCFHDCSPLF